MAYKSFLQRLLENDETVGVEVDADERKKFGDTSDFADAIHDIAEDLVEQDLADALGQGDTAEAYRAAVEAIRELHTAVCGEDCPFPGADDEEVELTEATGPQQISDVYEFFPNSAKKAALALADRGDLYIGKTPILSYRGHFDTDEKGAPFDSYIDIDAKITDAQGKDQFGYFQVKVSGLIGEPVASAYIAEYDTVEVLSEFEIDEMDFWEAFDRKFYDEFKMCFDDENPEHERLANAIHRMYLVSPRVITTIDRSGVDVSDVLDKSSAESEQSRLVRYA